MQRCGGADDPRREHGVARRHLASSPTRASNPQHVTPARRLRSVDEPSCLPGALGAAATARGGQAHRPRLAHGAADHLPGAADHTCTIPQASENERPARLSTQTARPAAVPRARKARKVEAAVVSVSSATVEHLDDRPTPSLLDGSITQSAPRALRATGTAATTGAGRQQRHRHGGHCQGVPRGSLLALVALVVLVEDDHPGQAEGRGTGAHAPARAPITVAPPAALAHSWPAALPARSLATQATPSCAPAGRPRADDASPTAWSGALSAPPRASAAARTRG